MATFDERFAGEQPQATLPPQISAQSLAPPAASAQEVPQTAQPQPNPQIAADLAEANTAIKEARQSIDDQKRIAEQKAQAQAPVIARMQQLASQPLPERKPAVQAPPAPQRSDPNADENWLFASAILGSLAGALTRRHQTNALAAFSGAVQGYQEGSQLKFDQNMRVWEAENKRAIEANQQAQQEYKDILENRKLSMEQMSIELQLAGQKHQDEAMVTTARTNNLLHIAQLLDTRARYEQQAETASQRISQTTQGWRERMWEENAREYYDKNPQIVERTILGLDPSPGKNVRTGQMGAYDRELRARIEADPRYQPGLYETNLAAKKQQALIPGRVQAAAESAAARTGATMGTRVEMATNEVEQLAPQALDASRNLPRGKYVPLNEIQQKGQQYTSVPQYADFLVANISLERAYGRAMNPQGVPRVTEMAEVKARGLLGEATSQRAYETQVRRILLEIKASNIAVAKTQGRPAPDTSNLDKIIESIPPPSKEELPMYQEGDVNKAMQTGVESIAPKSTLDRWQQQWQTLHPHIPELPPSRKLEELFR